MNPWGLKPFEEQTIASSNVNRAAYYYRQRRSWQKVPYDLVLPYYFKEGECEPGAPGDLGTCTFDAVDCANMAFVGETIRWDLHRNQAYERLRGRIYDEIDLATTFAEIRQSYGMIASAASGIVDSIRAVKRLQFGEAARALKMRAVPTGVRKSKGWEGNWLEYVFGWLPLMGTIYDGTKILATPLKQLYPKRGRSVPENRTTYTSSNAGSVTTHISSWYQFGVMQGAEVTALWDVEAFQRAQLGLANPLALAWELIPYSFVVDWFVNVGDLLGMIDDYAGMTLGNTFTTEFIRGGYTGKCVLNPGFSRAAPDRHYRGTGVQCLRTLGLTKPVFAVNRLAFPSKMRATTAIALVSQQLSGRAKKEFYLR